MQVIYEKTTVEKLDEVISDSVLKNKKINKIILTPAEGDAFMREVGVFQFLQINQPDLPSGCYTTEYRGVLVVW